MSELDIFLAPKRNGDTIQWAASGVGLPNWMNVMGERETPSLLVVFLGANPANAGKIDLYGVTEYDHPQPARYVEVMALARWGAWNQVGQNPMLALMLKIGSTLMQGATINLTDDWKYYTHRFENVGVIDGPASIQFGIKNLNGQGVQNVDYCAANVRLNMGRRKGSIEEQW